MTHQELDALPEDGTLTYEDALIDGRRVRVTRLLSAVALFQGPDAVMLIHDRADQAWTIGTANGVLCKRRMK